MTVKNQKLPLMSYSSVVKNARLNKKFTIRQLSERLGIAPSTITRIEKGDIEPKPSLKIKLEEVLGLDLSRFHDIESKTGWELRIASGFISFAAPLIRMQFGLLVKQNNIQISFDTSKEQGNKVVLQPDYDKDHYLKVNHGIGEDGRIRFDANDLIKILNNRNADAICISGPIFKDNWNTRLEEKPIKIAHLSFTAHTGVYLKFFFTKQCLEKYHISNVNEEHNIIDKIEQYYKTKNADEDEIPLLFVPNTLSARAYSKFTPLFKIPFIGIPINNPDSKSDYHEAINIATKKGVLACILWEPHLSWVIKILPKADWEVSKKIHFTKLAIEYGMDIEYFTFDLITTQAILKNKDKVRHIFDFLDLYNKEIEEIKRTINTKELLDEKVAAFLGMDYDEYDREVKRINFGIQYTPEFTQYINRYK